MEEVKEKIGKRADRPSHVTGLVDPWHDYWNVNEWWETDLLTTRFIQDYLGHGSETDGISRYNSYLQGILGQYTLRGSALKIARQLRSLNASQIEQDFLRGLGFSSPDELRQRIRVIVEETKGLQQVLRNSDQYAGDLKELYGLLQKAQSSGESFIRKTLDLMAEDKERRLDTDQRFMDLLGAELLEAIAAKLSQLDKEGLDKFMSDTPLFEPSFTFDPKSKGVSFKTKTINRGKYNQPAEERLLDVFSGKNLSQMSNEEIVKLIKEVGFTKTEKSFLRKLRLVAQSMGIDVPFGLSEDDKSRFEGTVQFEGARGEINIHFHVGYPAGGRYVMDQINNYPENREALIDAINERQIQSVVNRFGGDSTFLEAIMRSMIKKDKMAFFIGDNKSNIAGRLGEIVGAYIFGKLTNSTDVSGTSPTQSVLVYEATTKRTSGHAKNSDVSSDLTVRLANIMFGIQVKNYKTPLLERGISLDSLLHLSPDESMISAAMGKKLAYYYGSRSFYSQDKIKLIPQVKDFLYRAMAALHTIQISDDKDLNTNIGFLVGTEFVFSSEMLQVILEALNTEIQGQKTDALTFNIDEPGKIDKLLVKQDTSKDFGFSNSGFNLSNKTELLSQVKLTSKLDLGRMIAQNIASIAH